MTQLLQLSSVVYVKKSEEVNYIKNKSLKNNH